MSLSCNPSGRRAHDAKGEVSYAFGCLVNAHANEYLPIDAVAVLMTSMLSVGLGMKDAATVVREKWETWLRLVQDAERDPRLEKVILPAPGQLYLAVGIRDNGPPLVGAG